MHGPFSREPSTFSGKKRRLDTPESQRETTWTVDLAAHRSQLPTTRETELEQFPDVVVDLGSPDAMPETFTRQSLSSILGGSVQGLIVR